MRKDQSQDLMSENQMIGEMRSAVMDDQTDTIYPE